MLDKLAVSEKDEDKKLFNLVKKLQNKIIDRFPSLSQAFRFFDTSRKGKITLGDFQKALESLGL